MAQDEDWIAVTTERRWLHRLLGPAGNARPATGALLVGACGAAAFVASLSLSWQSVSIPSDFGGTGNNQTLTFVNSATSPDLLGLVYALGMVALLGLVGAVVNRSGSALRIRMMAAGLTVGLLGVVLAITLGLPDSVATRFGLLSLDGRGVTVAYQPGLLCAYVAVVLPIVSIWLASRSAAREVPDQDAERRGARHAVVPVTRRGASWQSVEHEPIDLTVTPEG